MLRRAGILGEIREARLAIGRAGHWVRRRERSLENLWEMHRAMRPKARRVRSRECRADLGEHRAGPA
jgi:hypothetical protein